jgi:hypothetical protein
MSSQLVDLVMHHIDPSVSPDFRRSQAHEGLIVGV